MVSNELLRNDANPYQSLRLEQLREKRKQVELQLEDAKHALGEIDDAIHSKVDAEVAMSRKYHQKPDGTIRVVVDGVEVASTVPKRVEWDSDLLDEVCSQLEVQGYNPMEYVKYKLSISETVYKKMPSDLRKMVDKARTTKHGKEKIELGESE